jgi:transcriptional regulator with XRE-family HTH domain
MTPLEPLLRELIGHALRRRRLEHRRTLADVSAQAGVSMQHLSDVERGRKDASSEILAAICGALGVTVTQLMAVAADSVAAQPAAQAAARPVLLDLTRAPRSAERPLAPSTRGVMLSAA